MLIHLVFLFYCYNLIIINSQYSSQNEKNLIMRVKNTDDIDVII